MSVIGTPHGASKIKIDCLTDLHTTKVLPGMHRGADISSHVGLARQRRWQRSALSIGSCAASECGWGGRLRSALRVACQRGAVGQHFGGTADPKTTSSRKFPQTFATLRRQCSVLWAFRDGQR